MKSTIICNKWDIILVNFPFTDLSSNKKRPSLIISPNEYNVSDDLIITFITSNIPSELKAFDFLINNWKDSGLLKPSLIRMKFATISKTIVHKKLGKLSDSDVQKFKSFFLNFFEK